MKHIILKLTFLFLLATIISCGNDSYDEKVVDSVYGAYEFTANSETATIELEDLANASVSSNQAWCTAKMSGKTLTIEVPDNRSIDGRSALLTLKSGDITGFVRITQLGAYFWIDGLNPMSKNISVRPEGKVLDDIKINSLLPYEIVKSDPWIEYSDDNGNLILTVGASSTPRQGTITFKSGNREDVYTVTQISYADFVGTWDFAYNLMSNSGSTPIKTTAELKVKESGISYTINCPDWPYEVTLLYNEENNSLVLAGGEEYGIFANVYLIVGGLINQNDGIRFNANTQMEAKTQIETKTTCQFADNESWAGQVIDRFQFGALENGTSYKGGIATYRDMVLSR